MKYNKQWIDAVYFAGRDGWVDAEELFNKLFDVAVDAPVVLSRDRLYGKLREIVGGDWVYPGDVEAATLRAGKPGARLLNVQWIKEFRTLSGFGLKQARDAHDFVRDNPSILA
jgi:hypothetical protein